MTTRRPATDEEIAAGMLFALQQLQDMGFGSDAESQETAISALRATRPGGAAAGRWSLTYIQPQETTLAVALYITAAWLA